MNDVEIKVGIAKAVCLRFINLHEATRRHALLVEFESLNILNEMETRNLIRRNETRDSYLPTIGTFALLGDDHELYQFARIGFERTIRSLWNLFCVEGPNVIHDAANLEIYSNKLFPQPAKAGAIPLGLYLASESGALQAMKLSADQMSVETFWIGETVISMKDPALWWDERIRVCREPLRIYDIAASTEQLFANYDESGTDGTASKAFSNDDFWGLIHEEVVVEARPRFEAGHYADAVEWALKAVAEKVRQRTGLKLDGSELMYRAFAPKSPYLEFEDPMPLTRDSMQQGYMQIFAGTMTGVRNPKVHGMVKLERERCIHFLFLASLLAFKVDEAVDTHPIEPAQKPASAQKPELASLHIAVGNRGMSGDVRTVNVSAVIENISTVKRITEYICTLSVPSSCLTFQSALHRGEIKSDLAGRRSFRRTEIDEGATRIVLPGDKLKVYSLDLGIDQLKLTGTWMEGDFGGALQDKVTLDAVMQGEVLHSELSVREIFEGMV